MIIIYACIYKFQILWTHNTRFNKMNKLDQMETLLYMKICNFFNNIEMQ